MPSLKRRVWKVVAPETKDHTGQRIDSAKLVLATLNVVAVIFQSVDSLYDAVPLLFQGFAVVSVLLFMALYVARLWAAPPTQEYGGTEGRLRLARRPFALLDLVVIVVFWVEILFLGNTLGGVRVLWFARVFDLPRFKRSRARFSRVIAAQREDLAIAFSGMGMLVLLSSTLMFFVESRAQPVKFGSIPAALWWGVVTLSTVGYGDVIPMTPLGRLLGGITTIGGIAFFALPASILAAGFLTEREREQREATTTAADSPTQCPHCGESLDPTGTAQN
ncbi:ion transporter [Haloferax sp. DFSO60]|uniref:ion transporter n=1 Tax=Haloferax sp. DFSO60 TaxID=3388652 RepID=UPI00397AFAC6